MHLLGTDVNRIRPIFFLHYTLEYISKKYISFPEHSVEEINLSIFLNKSIKNVLEKQYGSGRNGKLLTIIWHIKRLWRKCILT